MSYDEFKKAVLEDVKYNIWTNLSQEEKEIWEKKVDAIDPKDIDDVCKEHYNRNNPNIESCAWCVHMFA